MRIDDCGVGVAGKETVCDRARHTLRTRIKILIGSDIADNERLLDRSAIEDLREIIREGTARNRRGLGDYAVRIAGKGAVLQGAGIMPVFVTHVAVERAVLASIRVGQAAVPHTRGHLRRPVGERVAAQHLEAAAVRTTVSGHNRLRPIVADRIIIAI